MPSTLSHTLPQNENMMKTHYPMMVVPVRLLLGLERLLPHQEMLQRGLLLPYNQLSMKGRVMFISHQCAYSSRNVSDTHRCTPLAHFVDGALFTPFATFFLNQGLGTATQTRPVNNSWLCSACSNA